MLDQQHDAGRASADGSPRDARYHRPLPGGGYVEIEIEPARENGPSRGWLIVERRADVGRRFGHHPPIVAEEIHDDADALLAELFRLAHDNAALARRLMQWQSARVRVD
ncbi:MAG: hypothetical protein ABI601_19045 [bacterium]